MLKRILLLLSGLGVGLAAGFLFLKLSARQPNDPTSITIGMETEDFELEGLNGEVIQLSDLRGKIVVLNFWATWCPPCVEEMPLLDEVANRYNGEVVVVGINYRETRPVVEDFIAELEVDFLIGLDTEGEIARRFYVRSFPSTFFIDSEGVLRSQTIGPLTSTQLAAHLEKAGINQ